MVAEQELQIGCIPSITLKSQALRYDYREISLLFLCLNTSRTKKGSGTTCYVNSNHIPLPSPGFLPPGEA
ncbi:uncharacterized protein CIMG_12180 [Coccidioides immitis RS]|uniref:Uncharacterized protein n=4 Tax=Coccidioides immitis TaxID=5501 RepID=A0A0D8JTU3_COCIM|nr:uncharacterized protein CIMG_12180 [Coccidioides immitis RS]KJF60760.1 hypothetical protein CIMG_12180 [Coccidioides immitis RS]KMP06733.1 hypothetical protein CIRG_06414 [Coccidioides immitis RMSCC 2394]KMU77037.1 hypothetical protein CISG_06272 [Coccidioides immitis RMSCC 3703]KMU90471.1 hypothetical protein CIHG_08360 [Coccidioides immitis H538.4]